MIKVDIRKLKSSEYDGSPMDFEVIQYLNERWKAIGNHSSIDSIFGNYLGPLLNAFYGDIPEKDFLSDGMSTTEKQIVLSFYSSCKRYSTQTMSHKCDDAIDKLKSLGKFPTHDSRAIPIITCESYLKEGLDNVLVGMTDTHYEQELKDIFKLETIHQNN